MVTDLLTRTARHSFFLFYLFSPHLHEVPVLARHQLPSLEELRIGREVSGVSLTRNESLVVVEGDAAVLGVAGHRDDLAGVHEAWRQHLERQVGLDAPRRGHLLRVAEGACNLHLLAQQLRKKKVCENMAILFKLFVVVVILQLDFSPSYPLGDLLPDQ